MYFCVRVCVGKHVLLPQPPHPPLPLLSERRSSLHFPRQHVPLSAPGGYTVFTFTYVEAHKQSLVASAAASVPIPCLWVKETPSTLSCPTTDGVAGNVTQGSLSGGPRSPAAVRRPASERQRRPGDASGPRGSRFSWLRRDGGFLEH